MDRFNKEYIELLSEDVNPSNEFWSLDERIKENKKKTGVRVEMTLVLVAAGRNIKNVAWENCRILN